MFTLAEVRLLIEAVETAMLEYGERPAWIALKARLVGERERLIAEVES